MFRKASQAGLIVQRKGWPKGRKFRQEAATMGKVITKSAEVIPVTMVFSKALISQNGPSINNWDNCAD